MSDSLYRPYELTLVDLLDRLLGSGAAISGDVTIGIAGVDLVYLSLRALLASAGTVLRLRDEGPVQVSAARELLQQVESSRPSTTPSRRTQSRSKQRHAPVGTGRSHREGRAPGDRSTESPSGSGMDALEAAATALERSGLFPRHLDADPENVAEGLARLVLTLVELLRQLMERQAVRRVEAGGLSEDQIERMGQTLLQLERKMQEVKEAFGLGDEDLTLTLGPIEQPE